MMSILYCTLCFAVLSTAPLVERLRALADVERWET